MPSPFPGMDPYLESPALWEGFHSYLIIAIAAALNATLPSEFVARVGQRVYVMEPERKIIPDVTLQLRSPLYPTRTGGAAVLERPAASEISTRQTDMPLLVSSGPEEMRETFIDIVAVREGGHVVTAIELLSPSNKQAGSGADAYRRKQEQLLSSNTHLLEIDLLRDGRHSVAASRNHIQLQRTAFDYVSCLHRAGGGYVCEVWPFSLRDLLPRIHVPLTETYPDVPLDLPSAFRRAYADGAFDRSIDYTVKADPPLNTDDAAWADALLREKGLRS